MAVEVAAAPSRAELGREHQPVLLPPITGGGPLGLLLLLMIVLTNPRLLPFLSQVMGADPHVRYVYDKTDGWYLVDLTTGTEYKSLRDRGEASDYGYVGRLPRPDGKGTFLYLAGTHAQGTLGAAHYVTTNLSELYRELKARRFSTVIECRYDPGDPRKVVSTERVTPLYRHEGS